MKTDLELILTVRNMLWWNGSCRGIDIGVRVEHGCVTLSGEVEWEYQKRAALYAIRDLPDVVRVVNDLVVSRVAPQPSAPPVVESAPRGPDPVSRSRWS